MEKVQESWDLSYKHETKTAEQRASRIVGEAAEYAKAVLESEGDPDEEAVDCLIDSLSVVEQQFRGREDELLAMFDKKLAKYKRKLGLSV